MFTYKGTNSDFTAIKSDLIYELKHENSIQKCQSILKMAVGELDSFSFLSKDQIQSIEFESLIESELVKYPLFIQVIVAFVKA